MRAMIAIPAYSGTIHLGTMRSLIAGLFELANRGDSAEVNDECGNAMIADARAQIVAEFLASDCDQLVFIDHDVCWSAGALVGLLDHPVDVCAGIYPQRKDPITFPVRWIEECENLIANPRTGLLEVAGVPAGFLKITRAAATRMVDAYQNLEFFCERAPQQKAWGLFDPYRIEGTNLKFGEDYSFCQRWRDIGGQVWIDPEIQFGHAGTKTFVGHLGDHLRAINNVTHQPRGATVA